LTIILNIFDSCWDPVLPHGATSSVYTFLPFAAPGRRASTRLRRIADLPATRRRDCQARGGHLRYLGDEQMPERSHKCDAATSVGLGLFFACKSRFQANSDFKILAGKCLRTAREKRMLIQILREIEADTTWPVDVTVDSLLDDWGWTNEQGSF
jgi:hypothetical protein